MDSTLLPSHFSALLLGALPSYVGEKSRAAALGRLSVAYLLGMITGSTLGGQLSEWIGPSAVGFLAALLSVVMAVVTLQFLPERRTVEPTTTSATADAASKKLELGAALRMCMRPTLFRLVLSVAVAGLALSLQRSQMSVLMADHFKLEPSKSGYITAIGAALGAITNVFGISTLRARYTERQLLVGALTGLVCGFIAFAFCNTATQLLAVMVPLASSSTVLYTVSSALLSNAVDVDEAGTAVSISHSLRSAAGIIAPPLGGYLFVWLGVPAIGLGAAVLAALALVSLLLAPAVGRKKRE